MLAVGGVELANNARTVAYMQRGLGGPWFEAVNATPCPDLLLEAWPLTTCPGDAVEDSFFTNPLPTYRTMQTGVVPTGWTWREAGYLTSTAVLTGFASCYVVPNDGQVVKTTRLFIDMLGTLGATARSVGALKAIGVGQGTPANGLFGPVLRLFGGGGGPLSLMFAGRTPVTGTTFSGVDIPLPTIQPVGRLCLEAVWSLTGCVATVYDGDPDNGGVAVARQTYVYDPGIGSPWFLATGITEVAAFSSMTEIAVGSPEGLTVFSAAEAVIDEYLMLPGAPCVATGHLYPSDTLWPADDLYPDLYGEFHDPGTDNAPWVDADRPESYGFLGLLIDDIEGLDITSTRSMDAASTGIGGILGPETLRPRDMTVKGWLIADSCSSMEYARRWLGDALTGSLCANCASSFIDVRTTCGDDPAGDFYTNRWRIYDVGLTDLVVDTSDQERCCFVTPVTIRLGAEDPFLYGPALASVAATLLNGDGPDAPLVPFETWLFGAETPVCATVVDQGVGADAPIFTFFGGTSGIESAIVYPGIGAYPSDSLWPSDCLYPADGPAQWDISQCPTALTFSIGPGETFVVDNARRRIVWVLADGTVLDGSPKLNLSPGETVQYVDTCAGADIQACAVAYSACTCDDTASVTIQTMHRER